MPKYALIMPVRDEEEFIGPLMESVLAQDILPSIWIIVDDGSTDKTPQIIKSYAERLCFLELVRLPSRNRRNAGGEGAIAHALKRLTISDYDFLARFDADLLFEPDYFSRIIEEFRRDPQLGIAGGGLYVESSGGLKLERVPQYHVRGALKMYRRACFDQIGGITSEIGWDTIDEVYAWMNGWKTKSFFDLRVIHRRPTGEGINLTRIYWQRGKADYHTWSHPLFVFAKSAKTTLTTRSLRASICYLASFLSCYIHGEDRIRDPLFKRARRKHQLNRLISFAFREFA